MENQTQHQFKHIAFVCIMIALSCATLALVAAGVYYGLSSMRQSTSTTAPTTTSTSQAEATPLAPAQDTTGKFIINGVITEQFDGGVVVQVQNINDTEPSSTQTTLRILPTNDTTYGSFDTTRPPKAGDPTPVETPITLTDLHVGNVIRIATDEEMTTATTEITAPNHIIQYL